MTSVHLVVSCTDRKRRPVPAENRMRAMLRTGLQARVGEWIALLNGPHRDRVVARELYAGEHWTEVKKLLTAPPEGLEFKLWVVSAGYGLIADDSPLIPYAATFSEGHADAVRPKGANWTTGEWWKRLGEWKGPSPGSPRTLGQLSEGIGDDILVLSAAGQYLNALESDIRAVVSNRQPDRFVVFSASLPHSLSEWSDWVIEFDSRLLSLTGGSRIGLNIRAVSFALRQAREATPKAWKKTIEKAMKEVPPPAKPAREPASDQDILEFIKGEISKDPKASHSGLLRRWRRSGMACEQNRFRHLFQVVQDRGADRQTSLSVGVNGR